MTTQPEGAAVPQWTMGDRLRKARESANLQQQKLADMIDISRRSVSAYESGDSTPRRPVLLSWALATKTALTWLETGEIPIQQGPEGNPLKVPEVDSLRLVA